MTDQEIVQALRCCAKGLGHDDKCENCKVGEIQDRREYIEFAAANVIERLTAENAALLEKVPQWIRCKDELPQPEQAILTRDKWGHIRDRVFHKFLSGPVLFRPDGLAPIKDVTHWMPLPEAPEGGKHE